MPPTSWNLRLPQVEGEASPKRKFKTYPIGFFHLDIAEVQTAQGKLYLFVAIDRAKFAVAQLVDKANTQTARAFLEALVAAVPYRIEIVLTDNGIQFADLPKNRSGPTAKLRGHPFDRACREHGIEHRLTKPNHPWTTDVIDKCFLAGSELFSSRAWVTARRRAGREARGNRYDTPAGDDDVDDDEFDHDKRGDRVHVTPPPVRASSCVKLRIKRASGASERLTRAGQA